MPKGYSDKPRKSIGKAPRDGGTIIGNHEFGWILYELSIKTTDREVTWVNTKLISSYERNGRCNYWLSYNTTKQEFRITSDYKKLDLDYSDVLEWAGVTIQKWYDAKTETLLEDMLS